MPPRGAELRRYVRWNAVLDALEQDVDRVEKKLNAAAGDIAGASPTGPESLAAALPTAEELGPLPEGLTARAMALAQRQADALGHGDARLSELRRHLKIGEELIGSQVDPVYLDTIG